MKKYTVGFKLNQEEIEKLDAVCNRTGLKRSEIFRQRVLESDQISKQVANYLAEQNQRIEEIKESLDASIQFELESSLGELEKGMQKIIENKLEKIESNVINAVLKHISKI